MAVIQSLGRSLRVINRVRPSARILIDLDVTVGAFGRIQRVNQRRVIRVDVRRIDITVGRCRVVFRNAAGRNRRRAIDRRNIIGTQNTHTNRLRDRLVVRIRHRDRKAIGFRLAVIQSLGRSLRVINRVRPSARILIDLDVTVGAFGRIQRVNQRRVIRVDVRRIDITVGRCRVVFRNAAGRNRRRAIDRRNIIGTQNTHTNRLRDRLVVRIRHRDRKAIGFRLAVIQSLGRSLRVINRVRPSARILIDLDVTVGAFGRIQRVNQRRVIRVDVRRIDITVGRCRVVFRNAAGRNRRRAIDRRNIIGTQKHSH